MNRPSITFLERMRPYVEKLPRLREARMKRNTELWEQFKKGLRPDAKQQAKIRQAMIAAELDAAAKRLEAHRAR